MMLDKGSCKRRKRRPGWGEGGEGERGECTAHRYLGGRCGSRSRCWGFCRGIGPGARRGLSRVRRRMVLRGREYFVG